MKSEHEHREVVRRALESALALISGRSDSADDAKAQRRVNKAHRNLAAVRRLAEGVHPDSLLSLDPDATSLTGLSKASLYRKAQSDPTFPPLIRLSSRCTRLRAGPLLDWLKAQGGE